jgi:hypothetical protein
VWAFLLGANIVIFSILMIAAKWRLIISIVRSIPSAVYAAITAEERP